MDDTQDKGQEDTGENSNKTTEYEFKNKSLCEKICYIKSSITVEPTLAGLIIASIFTRLAMQNLNLDKACRQKFDFGDEICNNLLGKKENMTYYEGEVQKIVSSYEAFKSILSTSVPTILVVIMGAWSDRTGNRKACILLPIVGEFLVCLSNIISTALFYEIPVEVTMFFEAFFPAFSGGWVMMYLGVFSYISDITTEESRTFRVGLTNLCLTAGIQIGTALSGVLVRFCGYYGTFSISATINIITFLYGYFCLKSSTKPIAQEIVEQKPSLCTELVAMIKETVKTAFKRRNGGMRKKIILTLLVVIIIYGPDHGERGLRYFYTRYQLKWDALQYSVYSTYGVVTNSIGALFSITVFSKRWGWHDSMLCMISITSKLIGSIYISLVRNDVQMFILPIVEILNATTFTSLRSMASKLVQKEEMGKMNSLFSLVETLAALVFDPTYSTLYSNTVTWFSGTVFLFSAGMTLPAISILIWLFTKHRQEIREEQIVEADNIETDKQDITTHNEGIKDNAEITRI